MKITASYRLIISALILSFIAVSCATTGARKIEEFAETVTPKRSYEECFELYPGETLEYSFTSSNPLDFNIHYHAVDGVKYPVDKKNIRTHKGTFVCNEQKYYTEDQEAFCMIWENHGEAFVNLKVKFRIRPDTPDKK